MTHHDLGSRGEGHKNLGVLMKGGAQEGFGKQTTQENERAGQGQVWGPSEALGAGEKLLRCLEFAFPLRASLEETSLAENLAEMVRFFIYFQGLPGSPSSIAICPELSRDLAETKSALRDDKC